MASTLCYSCKSARALIIRPKNRHKLCKLCFLELFEQEIHDTIVSKALFYPGERVAIGASGGKDSTVLASVLKTLNERHNYGLHLTLLSIDEGIKGYRDDSLETVKRNAAQYSMPLEIVGYDELRQALDRGAAKLGIKHVVTGHNADDVAETVMMNLLRGDLPRLSRATSIVTESSASDIKRSKPLKYAYEKEIVLYAHHKKLDYFSTECIYSPEAFRGSARTLIKDLEKVRPSSILDIVRSGEDMARLVPPEISSSGKHIPHTSVAALEGDAEDYSTGGCGSQNGPPNGRELVDIEKDLSEDQTTATHEIQILPTKKPHGVRGPGQKPLKLQTMGRCVQCGYLASQRICKACMLLAGLNKGRPKTSIEVAVGEKAAQHL
ncbi:hypothetical protein ACO22_04693 [Paracoccidioides brasiliensis]|uniref:Cytoplasmic tRNA 2-thiolation protein 1 n=1 Tax=Paracoccidioides brasiliensis TaxID=121759 RepID=A0A1D2JCD9_PARBR|nr:hypothetical protein ACO22_04693 [Paracoccidioides brasiliensis]